METIEIAPDGSWISLTHSTPDRALALRDALVQHVYTLAIRFVEIADNDSETQSEILTHRLGLVPILFLDGRRVSKHFYTREKCPCQSAGCARCVVQFDLDLQGPCVIHSHDLKCRNPLVSAMPNFPLATLASGRVRLSAQACVGSGATRHVAITPVVGFFTSPHIVQLNPERRLTLSQIRDLVDACPKQVFDMEDGHLVVANTSSCHGCKECVRKSLDFRDSKKDPHLVTIRVDDTQFHFPIESVGQLMPLEIVHEALEFFHHKS